MRYRAGLGVVGETFENIYVANSITNKLVHNSTLLGSHR